jgi:hypothetical protein
MNVGFPISRVLKEIKSPNGDDRLARAMYLANAFAFHVKLDPAMNSDQFAETQVKPFKDLLNEVNEHTSVDTRKAQELLRQLLRIRYELLNGGCSAELICAALCSEVTEENLTRKEQGAVNFITSRADFMQTQTAIGKLLVESGAA